MGIIIYTRRISRYLKAECFGRSRIRNIEIYNNRRISSRFKERVW